MKPIARLDLRMILGVSPDTRPAPMEFAEFFALMAHAAHAGPEKKEHIDSRMLRALIALAKGAKQAQVFDFGEIKERHLMKEAELGGSLMGQLSSPGGRPLLRLPYPAVLYWYTVTEPVSTPALYIPGLKDEYAKIRYVTLAVEQEEDVLVTDFLLLDPETAAIARKRIMETATGTERETAQGRHFLACNGIAQLKATPGGRWQGYLFDRPGDRASTEIDGAVLGSLADGMAAMTMILSTRGISTRYEPAPVKLNVKREKSGKPPYPSITYVNTRQYFDAVQRTALGGTHASPVPHLRRGHKREYQDGRRTWVRPALVNCRSLAEAQPRDHYEVVV